MKYMGLNIYFQNSVTEVNTFRSWPCIPSFCITADVINAVIYCKEITYSASVCMHMQTVLQMKNL